MEPASKTTATILRSGQRDWIGYTELRTNLPGGRHANVATMRACVVRPDGTGWMVLAEELIVDADTWTQFAGWSPDGRQAVICCGWESASNAAWEEEHREFRQTEGWRLDSYLLDLETGRLTCPTAVERVSEYNGGIFFWPGDPSRLGLTALIDGVSHPFVMDLDGRNKTDLSQNPGGFAYGYSASPDGALVSYHEDYQVYIARADGSGKRHVATGNAFNFGPTWSPDGRWLCFLSGEHYNCHPWVVARDGTGLRKIGDRGGYVGGVEFLDVYDFHGGSSDVPVWSPDGRWIGFTSKVGESIELFMAALDGETRRLTHSRPRVMNYQPKFMADGRRILFGSNRTGVRQLYILTMDGDEGRAITAVPSGHAAMWPYGQPE